MKSLAEKMRITKGTSITVINAPSGYDHSLGILPEGVSVQHHLSGKQEFIHLFVKNRAELEALFSKVFAALKPEGLIWISFPKGSSGMQTDLNRDKGWEHLQQYNMEWLGLISFNDHWSAFLMCNRPPKMIQSKASKDYHNDQVSYADAKTKTVTVPDDLKAAFKKTPAALVHYEALSYTNKKEYVMWIVGAKRDETRMDRVTRTIEKLLSGKRNPAEK